MYLPRRGHDQPSGASRVRGEHARACAPTLRLLRCSPRGRVQGAQDLVGMDGARSDGR
jgi:hypothetical protein